MNFHASGLFLTKYSHLSSIPLAENLKERIHIMVMLPTIVHCSTYIHGKKGRTEEKRKEGRMGREGRKNKEEKLGRKEI